MKTTKNRDGYQVVIGNDEDVIDVQDLTELQAKETLCRMIDKLESLESQLFTFQKSFKGWRNIKAPKG